MTTNPRHNSDRTFTHVIGDNSIGSSAIVICRYATAEEWEAAHARFMESMLIADVGQRCEEHLAIIQPFIRGWSGMRDRRTSEALLDHEPDGNPIEDITPIAATLTPTELETLIEDLGADGVLGAD